MFLPFLLPLLAAATAAPQPQVTAQADGPRIIAFGDSLTAGYGLGRGLGFAPQLQASLRRHGIAAVVHDAGVSGDTSSGGRARLGWTLDGLPTKPDLAIVELGANDMLRGVDPAVTEQNLDAILAELKRRQIPVVVAGMLSSRNLDPGYRQRFDAIYPRLARKHDATLYPFFLQGVAGSRALNLGDGVHPNFEGIKRIVAGILPTVKRSLEAQPRS